MSCPRKVIRSSKLTTYLPEDLRAKLDLRLFSPFEGRVPKGAYTELLIELVKKWLEEGEVGAIRPEVAEQLERQVAQLRQARIDAP